MRTRTASVVALLLLIALMGACLGTGAEAQPKLRPFTFILDFLPYGEYTPYFTALDKGWYRDEGLDVKILRGSGSGDTVKRIAVGQGDAGSADFSALVGGRGQRGRQGARDRGVLPPPAPLDLRTRGDGRSTRRRTWRARRSPITPGNSHGILFPLLAKLAGFRADSVKWVTMDGAAMGPALITGRVDGAPFFANHEAAAAEAGEDAGHHPQAPVLRRRRLRHVLAGDLHPRGRDHQGGRAAEGVPARHRARHEVRVRA